LNTKISFAATDAAPHFQETHHEKDIQPQPDQAQTGARLPRAHEHGGGTRNSSAPARQRTQAINRLTFGREHRLTGKKAFALCFDAGRRLFSTSFVLFVRQREDAALPWRLGLAVTRKIGPAVWRNRTRRLIREVFRLGREDIPSGRDYVVTVRRGFNPRLPGFDDVRTELLPLLRSCPARKNTRKLAE
jgi:ribonuclease P protein component